MTLIRSRALRIMAFVAALAALVQGAAGCRVFGRGAPPEPLARQDVVARLRETSREFRTLKDMTASLHVSIEGPDGESQTWPSLSADVAFDIRVPGLWLSAQKVFSEVFTLKAGGRGFWLALPHTLETVSGGPRAYAKLPHIIPPAAAMVWLGTPEWLGLDGDAPMSVKPEHYLFDVSYGGVKTREVYVDRWDVRVAQIIEYSFSGGIRADVSLADWRRSGGIDFPRDVTVYRPAWGRTPGVRIRLKFGRPEFSVSLNPLLFAPGRRPGWRHTDLDVQPLSDVEFFRGQE